MTENSSLPETGYQHQKQWAARVVEYSSQYNDSTWSANQVIGPPKVYPRHGDITGAWAQGNRAADEYITVEFERAFYPERLDIYETFNPGAVVRVSVRNSIESTPWVSVWHTDNPHVEGRARIFSVPCRGFTNSEINQVRLDVNCSAASNWCEIDAIQLLGHPSLRIASYRELISSLKTLINDETLSDVCFQLDDGNIFHSQTNILTCRSIYFEELLRENSAVKSRSIRIENISSDAFYQILHFIYTDKIEPVLSFETCLELMRKADEFHLCLIYPQALEILKTTINKNNVLQVFVQSGIIFNPSLRDDENILLPEVVDFCVEFIQKNRREIYSGDQIRKLSKEFLLELVQRVQ